MGEKPWFCYTHGHCSCLWATVLPGHEDDIRRRLNSDPSCVLHGQDSLHVACPSNAVQRLLATRAGIDAALAGEGAKSG